MKTEREIKQEVTVKFQPETSLNVSMRKRKKPTFLMLEELSSSKKGKNNNKGNTKKKVGGGCSMRGSKRVNAKQTPTPEDIPEEQLNAKDEENAKASSEEREINRKFKKTVKTLAIFEKQSNDEEKEDIVESNSEETSRKTDKSKNKKSAAKRKRSSKHPKQDEMSSSDEDKPKAKRPKMKSSRKKGRKGKKKGKQGNECEYSENDIIDETETGADILKLLLHHCKLPFEVQNKLLFYLDDDEINVLAQDRIKSKEGYEAGPTFMIMHMNP